MAYVLVDGSWVSRLLLSCHLEKLVFAMLVNFVLCQ